MDTLNVINLEAVVAVLGEKKLSDRDFIHAELLQAEIEKPVEIGEVTFGFGVSGGFKVSLFNSADDADTDGVIGKEPGSILPVPTEQAWLKYEASSVLKAAAGLDLSNVGFDIDVSRTLRFASYRLHEDQNASLRKSVIDDFKPFLFIANVNHVKTLRANEVLTVDLPGKLNVEVSLAWSDIFTGAFAVFQNLLKDGQLLNFELSAKVEVTFAVSVDDDFSLRIRKNSGGTYQVYFTKTSSKQIGGSLAAGIEVGFKDANATKAILGGLAEGLVSKLKDKIQPILDKNPLSKLNDGEKEIVSEIAETLGFDAGWILTVSDLEAALNEKLGPVIESVAIAKVKAGFSYEYNRIAQTQQILEAELTEAALERYHGSLIRFKLEARSERPGLLTDLRKQEQDGGDIGVKLVSYLNEKTISRRLSWGFTLGIGGWEISGMDYRNIDETIRENAAGNKQVAFLGTRKYEGKLAGSVANWKTDFNSEMDRFSQQPMPLVNELKYGLFLLMEWKDKNRFGKEIIADIVDQAVLWNVIGAAQFEDAMAELTPILTDKKMKNVSASVHLKFLPEIFPTVFNNMARLLRSNPSFATELIAKSLAAGMTHIEQYPVRRNVPMRVNAYAPLWKYCLASSGETETDRVIEQDERNRLAYAASERLKVLGEHMLAAQEIDPNYRNSADDVHFSSLLAMNARVRSDWSLFKNGILKLSDGYRNGVIYADVVASAFNGLQCFWTESHYVRALGHYLLNFTNNEVLMSSVERSLTISFEKDGEAKVINFGGKSA